MKERKRITKYLLPFALVMVLGVALAFGIFFMRNSLMKLTVEERSNQLEEMLTQIRANLDSGLQTHWNLVEELGMQITRAVDGEEAVRCFAENPKGTFDIILMDVMMPEMNGYEATKAIRRIQNRPDAAEIPIIAMTANAFAEDVQASLDAGMNGHLSKPIVMDEVIKTIARNLDR